MDKPDPVLEGLWKRVLEDWDNDDRHGAFLNHCQATGQLVEAAVRYRGMKGDRDRGSSAEKRLGGVAILAMAHLDAERSRERPKPRRWGPIMLCVFFVLASVGLLAILKP